MAEWEELTALLPIGLYPKEMIFPPGSLFSSLENVHVTRM